MTTAIDRLLESREGREALCIEQTITNVTELIWGHLNNSKMQQADLAKAMGVTPGRVSQLLKGHQNLTLKTVARALAAFDQVMEVTSVPVTACGRGWLQWNDLAKTPCATFAFKPVAVAAPARSPPEPKRAMVGGLNRGWVSSLRISQTSGWHR